MTTLHIEPEELRESSRRLEATAIQLLDAETDLRRAADAACLLAVARWASDDHQGALDAVEQALEADPQHRMAPLIGGLVGRGVPAAHWFGSMSHIREADCLRFDRPRPVRASVQPEAG